MLLIYHYTWAIFNTWAFKEEVLLFQNFGKSPGSATRGAGQVTHTGTTSKSGGSNAITTQPGIPQDTASGSGCPPSPTKRPGAISASKSESGRPHSPAKQSRGTPGSGDTTTNMHDPLSADYIPSVATPQDTAQLEEYQRQLQAQGLTECVGCGKIVRSLLGQVEALEL